MVVILDGSGILETMNFLKSGVKGPLKIQSLRGEKPFRYSRKRTSPISRAHRILGEKLPL